MEFDYNKLRLAAVKDMATTLGDVGGSDWEEPSLCDGWQVRHVPAHIITGYLFSPEEVAEVVAEVGSVPEAVKRGAIQFASALDAATIVDEFERHVGQPEPTGVAAIMSPPELFVDQVVHRFDVAIPLGLRADVSEELLFAALSTAPSVEGFIGSKDRASGLRLEATDVDWMWGEGPVVRGSAEALLLALSGRPCGVERCEGAGVELLAAKQGVDGRSRDRGLAMQ
ncbi:MAG TPA: maleylpyruvate isomerase family mycothiol-dependent enzyme [Acidimicrobiales bacterium]|nr:maleylpyruvate isomerase family mycothiol-dependent enzyme [Acidimicrobiales bacterium]